MLKTSLSRFAVISLVALISSGCATPPKKIHADYGQRASTIRSVGVLYPDINMYELNAGGVREKIDTWCEQGRQNFVEALKEELSKRTLEVKTVKLEGDFRENLEEVNDLYDFIIYSFNVHTAEGPNLFPEKHDRFDYSVGQIDGILDAYHVDSLLLVHGFGEVSTGGRKAATVVGALMGIGYRPGYTIVNMALVDRSGTLLWHENFIKPGGATDLRNARSVKVITGKMLTSLPEAAK